MYSTAHKKWRLFRAWFSRKPIWCAWQVNYKCNFTCSFCHYWRDPAGADREQTVEDFVAGSAKLAGLGSLMISLAGGEPLLRTDMPDVVAAIAEHHFPFMTTNGWFVTQELADELFAAGLWGVSISIDYADAGRHDRQRGMPGAFDRAVAAVDMFLRARRYPWQRVNVIAVLLHDNLEQMEPLAKLAADHGASFMLQPYSDRKTTSQRFRRDGAGVGDYLLDVKSRHGNMLSNPYFLSQFDKALDGGVPDCRAGRAFFNIDSRGDIAICVEKRDTPVANLYDHDARQVVARLRAASEGNACTACWYNCRGEVESLYKPSGLLKRLPILFQDGRG